MFGAMKRKLLMRKYFELVTRLTISERAAKMYREHNLEEYAKLEDKFIERTNMELVRICMELNDLSPE